MGTQGSGFLVKSQPKHFNGTVEAGSHIYSRHPVIWGLTFEIHPSQHMAIGYKGSATGPFLRDDPSNSIISMVVSESAKASGHKT